MFQALKNKFKKEKVTVNLVLAPISGDAVPLSEVNDPVFSGELMGKGIAIIPKSGRVVAPVNGKIFSVFETKHAISIVSELGTEILIHIGLNTVNLKGQFFKTFVNEGDTIKAGDLLVEFEIDNIKSAGYNVITPVIICNTADYAKIETFTGKQVNELDEVMRLHK